MKVEIESYLEAIRKLGVSLELPLIIEVPCRTCRTIEVYAIYETHYKYIRSYKKQ